MKEQLLQYVNYNLWANKLIADILLKHDPSLFDKEIKSSFPSIRKTVNHILDAEVIWLARLKYETMKWPPSETVFIDPDIVQFVEESEKFLAFVQSRDDNWFEEKTTFKDSKGNEYAIVNSGILMHVMNHSTFHRGQIVTMLRELGVTELTSTDLITYIRLNLK